MPDVSGEVLLHPLVENDVTPEAFELLRRRTFYSWEFPKVIVSLELFTRIHKKLEKQDVFFEINEGMGRRLSLKQSDNMRDTVFTVIKKIENILDNHSIKGTDRELLEALDGLIVSVNEALFPGGKISEVYDFDIHRDDMEKFRNAFAVWRDYMESVMEGAEQKPNKVEKDMEYLMSYLEAASTEDMEELLKDNLEFIKKTSPQLYEQQLLIYRRYESFWGDLNPEEGIFDLIEQRAKALKEHMGDFRWLFGELCDNRSKRTLYDILLNWITFRVEWIVEGKENVFGDYFDLDLIPHTSEDEVFVDLGGWIGDTVKDFALTYSAHYKRIYTYEINPENLAVLRETVKGISNVTVREYGVGEKEGTLYLDLMLGGSCTMLGEEGEQPVKVVTLDDDITERVTWIKMDIEGSEQSALRGCERHIREEKPKLTICTYHNNEDIWKILRMIKEYNPEYRLYFRSNGGTIHPSEYVIFAL